MSDMTNIQLQKLEIYEQIRWAQSKIELVNAVEGEIRNNCSSRKGMIGRHIESLEGLLQDIETGQHVMFNLDDMLNQSPDLKYYLANATEGLKETKN